MTDDQPTSERLESLKFRWESDKGSRLFLQLADEYRRLGREEDAIAVLDEGLESSPGHVGARVVRARCLLALERAKEAAEDLEKAIESDPTQMVAYRLLVEAYIRLQNADQARHRLQVYGLLNDSDPDIPELDKKIRELERAERTGEWPVHAPKPPSDESDEPGEEVEPDGDAARAEPEGDAEPFPQAPPPEPSRDAAPSLVSGGGEGLDEAPFGAPTPEEDLPPFGEETGAEAPLPAREESPVAAPASAATPDPFPALGLPEDERRYRASLDDDLFASPGEETGPGEGSEEPAATPETLAKEASPAPAPPGEAAATTTDTADPFDLPPRTASEVPDLGDALLGEGDPRPEAQTPEPAGPVELPVAPNERQAPEPSPVDGPPVPGEGTEPEEGRPTVTLGRLYLRQGHLDEAESIFREVMHRNPENAAAREGLDEVALRRAPGLAAAELLESYEPETHGEGLTARKRYALQQYLERLRGGGSDVH